MIYGIISLGEKVVAAEALVDQYRDLVSILLLFSFGIYRRFIKHKWKLYHMACDCDPTDVFDQMRIYREPTQCGAGKKCISNALYDLAESINEATESIDIAMPEFTMPQLLEAILKAHSRFVDIRLILNASEGLENSPHIKAFLDAGIDVRFANRPINGAFCLIDPEFDGIVIKSPTWTHAAFFKSNGEMRFDTHMPLSMEYEEIFNSMWKESKPLATKHWLLQIILKPKLIRRLLPKCEHVSGSLRDCYSNLRTGQRIFRALGTNRR